MNEDEIDQFVDRLFREGKTIHDGQIGVEKDGYFTPSGDKRIDRVDEVIQDTYDEAIGWHNNRISQGTDPRSGLRGSGYIPWDERIDGAAAMMGNGGGETSVQRNGGTWRAHGEAIAQPEKKRGLTCVEFIAICVVVLFLLGFMAWWAA